MVKRLRRAMKEINRRQNGQVLIIVLIVLALGGIVLAPTLNHAASSIKHQQLIETDALELYAADSGIDYALFKMSNGETDIGDYPLNGKTVSVDITDMGDGSYLITSTATSAGGSNTTIRTGVSSSGGFASLLDNAITSNGDVDIKGYVEGDVTASGSIDGKDNVDGTTTEGATIENWPSAEDFSTFYGTDVDTGNPKYPGGVIDLNGVSDSIEPCYIDDELTINNSSNPPAILTLNGTLYITGDTTIKPTKELTLDLNGQTIFVESASSDPQKALEIGGKCTIIGSGCIIAVGDVYFAPKGDVGSESDFVFIMSVTGTTTLRPSGTNNGSVAGNIDVVQQSGVDPRLIWNSLGSEGDLNFPYEIGVVGGSTEDMVLGGWDIS